MEIAPDGAYEWIYLPRCCLRPTALVGLRIDFVAACRLD